MNSSHNMIQHSKNTGMLLQERVLQLWEIRYLSPPPSSASVQISSFCQCILHHYSAFHSCLYGWMSCQQCVSSRKSLFKINVDFIQERSDQVLCRFFCLDDGDNPRAFLVPLICRKPSPEALRIRTLSLNQEIIAESRELMSKLEKCNKLNNKTPQRNPYV